MADGNTRVDPSSPTPGLARKAERQAPVHRRRLERWLRGLAAAGFALHFMALALNSLPNSRFIATLYPYYGFYPSHTGQNQAWMMYAFPDRHATEYELQARFPDGHWEHPWGTSHQMSARKVYFLEATFGATRGEAGRFFEALRARYPEQRRPIEIRLRQTSRPLNAFSDVPARGIFAGEEQVRDLNRIW
ncbi:MAG TPA: hypothetical protein VFQ61_25925 [Polyangiaceae bacterium]|nr:hypothetical protein [Polyangiaceae bacterium]